MRKIFILAALCLCFGLSAANYTSDRILVAASNSTENDKANADFVCTGTNDERVIQQAIDSCGSYGNVILLPGKYYLDEFIEYSDTDNPSCIRLPHYKGNGGAPSLGLKGATEENGAFLLVTQKALEGLGDRQGTVLNISKNYGPNTIIIKYADFSIRIADNKHKVIAIDTYMAGRCRMESIRLYQDGYGPGKMPVEGSVGVRCTDGNPNGIGQEMCQVGVTGFYEGFQMGGEHMVAIECLTRNCYYGYTFGNYKLTHGVAEHPITLINCCDELSAALPLFVSCGASVQNNKRGMQQVDMIGFNMELRPLENPTLAPVIPAKEVTPNSFCGRIEFVANKLAYSHENAVDVQFWEEGSGQNFKTVNSTHKLGGTSAERESYTPMYMQQYYDTDLGKMLIFDGKKWVDMNGRPCRKSKAAKTDRAREN